MKFLIKKFYFKWIQKRCRHLCFLCKFKKYCLPELKNELGDDKID